MILSIRLESESLVAAACKLCEVGMPNTIENQEEADALISANRIRAMHARIQMLEAELGPLIIDCGCLLRQIKRGLKHGDWLPWVEKAFPFTPRTAQRYMRACTAPRRPPTPRAERANSGSGVIEASTECTKPKAGDLAAAQGVTP